MDHNPQTYTTVRYVDKDTGEISDKEVPADAPFIRTEWNYDMNAASLETAVDCQTPPEDTRALDPHGRPYIEIWKEENFRTQQHFKEECDINVIMERFGLGVPVPESFKMPQYGDFTGALTDYQTALNYVIQAEAEFMKLPARLRERFGNDPNNLVTFLDDASNREEAVSLKLLREPEAPSSSVQGPVAPPGPST